MVHAHAAHHGTDGAAAGGTGHGKFLALAIGSVGVVYGDIGTSPLYAFREAVIGAQSRGIANQDAVFGVLSLILWALILVATVKYVCLLLKADNNGEGGTFALMALSQGVAGQHAPRILLLGIIGAAFFYGDAIITPAISVVSAVEGLKLVHPDFSKFVVPASIVILVALFCIQSRGTALVARFFGPITVVWFLALAIGGLLHVADDLSVLAAFNPVYGVRFAVSNGIVGLVVLGLVFLAVTGAEALYADLGHFGRKPIQAAWFALVLPSLALNYLGQGALVLADPDNVENAFYQLYPSWALIPMLVLATAATVIASQAVITGAFSLTRQAIQLGLLPRMRIRHTSESMSGQIYMPRVNWALLAGVLLLVILFRSSSSLAAAYGVAVTTTMVITSVMAVFVIWKLWNWSLWATLAVIVPFIGIELVFFGANLLKVFDGGWMPLALAGFIMFAVLTWIAGVRIVERHNRKRGGDLEWLTRALLKKPPQRVSGTAAFLTSTPDAAPTALMHNLKHNRVLHERNIILTIKTEDVPRVHRSERLQIEKLSDGFIKVIARYGFMETPSVPRILENCRRRHLNIDVASTSFFLSRRSLVPTAGVGLPFVQERLFILMASLAEDATTYFGIPTDRVVEIGTQVEI